MEWRIYYDDGSTFSNEDGMPQDAPGYGAICIVQSDPLVNRSITSGFDWYWWLPDKKVWQAGDIFGLLDRLCHRLPTEAVTAGRSVPTEEFSSIVTLADKDPDFPPGGILPGQNSRSPVGTG